MKRKVVIQLESETYMEEQFLLDKFPDAVWLNIGGSTKFYVDLDEKERVLEAITQWKELEANAFEV